MKDTKTTKRAQDEVNRIADENKERVTADMILDSAKRKNSPMHDYFEWDNTVAGKKYREQQARKLIRGITVTIVSRKIEIKSVAYVRDPKCENNEQGYVSVASVRTDEDIARDVLLDEFTRVSGALTRARNLAAVFDLVDDVDAFIEKVDLMKIHVGDGAQA